MEVDAHITGDHCNRKIVTESGPARKQLINSVAVHPSLVQTDIAPGFTVFALTCFARCT